MVCSARFPTFITNLYARPGPPEVTLFSLGDDWHLPGTKSLRATGGLRRGSHVPGVGPTVSPFRRLRTFDITYTATTSVALVMCSVASL